MEGDHVTDDDWPEPDDSNRWQPTWRPEDYSSPQSPYTNNPFVPDSRRGEEHTNDQSARSRDPYPSQPSQDQPWNTPSGNGWESPNGSQWSPASTIPMSTSEWRLRLPKREDDHQQGQPWYRKPGLRILAYVLLLILSLIGGMFIGGGLQKNTDTELGMQKPPEPTPIVSNLHLKPSELPPTKGESGDTLGYPGIEFTLGDGRIKNGNETCLPVKISNTSIWTFAPRSEEFTIHPEGDTSETFKGVTLSMGGSQIQGGLAPQTSAQVSLCLIDYNLSLNDHLDPGKYVVAYSHTEDPTGTDVKKAEPLTWAIEVR